MKLRQFAFITALLTAAFVAGSGSVPHRTDTREAARIVDYDGLADVEFGDTEQELTRRGKLRSRVESCGPVLAGHEAASPIFVDDRLVLLWVDDTVRTPEGITAGTPVEQVWSSYPSVTRLTAPPETYRFDGLLAREGDRAYLFLHDGRAVRKVIAGYADWARRLFDEGHGPC